MKPNILHRIVVFLIRIFSITWRFKFIGEFPKKPSIIVFWHGKMLAGWKIFSDFSPIGVVSHSRDGNILSYLLTKWNYSLIRGSSSKGGSEVLKEIVENQSQTYFVITPDGPRGPIYKFKPGAVVAAQRKQIPLYLCSMNIKNKKTLEKSWDKFEIPLLFSKIEVKFSEPIFIPQNTDRNQISEIISDCEKKL